MAAAGFTNGATTYASKLYLEAMQTVTPTNPTDPKISLPVSIPAGGDLDSGIFSRRFSLVLCYKKASDEDSASLVAGWIRESLGKALSEQPIFAGRLRRKDDVGGGLEIVLNDSGVRLIEAQFSMSLQEFLDLEDKKEAESHLVFWDDIDYKQNPQFSPLCYIQVSNFKCGGYAIGFSCSLLLFDPFSMASFLKKWTGIHLKMVISRTENYNKLPVFYRPKIGNNRSRGLPTSAQSKTKMTTAAQTLIFDINTSKLALENKELIQKTDIAAQCVHESVQKLEMKIPGNVSVVVKEPPEEDDNNDEAELTMCRVQNLSKEEILLAHEKLLTAPAGVISSNWKKNWDGLGIDGICFREGNKAVHVSCWINSVLDEGFAMVFPSHLENGNEKGLRIIVALSN